MIKIGIIGVGNISVLHMDSYIANPDTEICAVCDINEKRLDLIAEKYGIEKKYTDYNEMLKLPELDAVSICTWNNAHAPCAIKALEMGKHVLCEKPMAMNAKEAAEMAEAAKRSGKLLMIGFVRRFGNDCAILRDFIKSGSFGDIYHIKASYLRRMGNPGGWFGEKSKSGGGPLIDLGVHIIDLSRYLMGNPKPVSVYAAAFTKLFDRKNIKQSINYVSAGKSDKDICDVEDFVSAMIRFDNDAVLSVETSFSLNIKNDKGDIELFGTKSGARLDPELEIFTDINDYLADVKLNMPTALSFEGLFESEVNHFVECIKSGVKCISPAEDGVEIMRILDAAYESARTGHEVRL